MGLEESKLGPMPESVTAFYQHYHTLNANEKWYFRRHFLEDHLEEQRVKHSYFHIDLPFEEWLLIAEESKNIDYLMILIPLWKSLKPYIKCISIGSGRNICLCLTNTTPNGNLTLETLAEVSHEKLLNPVIEYKGMVMSLSDLFDKMKFKDDEDKYDWTWSTTYSEWLEYKEDEEEEEEGNAVPLYSEKQKQEKIIEWQTFLDSL